MAYVIKMSVWGDTSSGKEKHMPTGRSHATDLRVRKSIRDIKRAVLALIAREPFEQIRIEEIATEAMINRKTFYNHFSSKNDVLDAIEEDLVTSQEQGLKGIAAENLRGGVLLFYHLLDTDDTAYHKLFTEEEYIDFFGKLVNDIFSLEFYRKFYEKAASPEIMPGYFASAASIYNAWSKKPSPKESLEELSDVTATLFMKGVQGL